MRNALILQKGMETCVEYAVISRGSCGELVKMEDMTQVLKCLRSFIAPRVILWIILLQLL